MGTAAIILLRDQAAHNATSIGVIVVVCLLRTVGACQATAPRAHGVVSIASQPRSPTILTDPVVGQLTSVVDAPYVLIVGLGDPARIARGRALYAKV